MKSNKVLVFNNIPKNIFYKTCVYFTYNIWFRLNLHACTQHLLLVFVSTTYFVQLL